MQIKKCSSSALLGVLLTASGLTSSVTSGASSHVALANNASSSACDLLRQALPDQLYSAGTQNYYVETENYWSSAAALSPYCVFTPSSAQNLADGIKILVKTNTRFTVRSGGHSPITGVANIDHGVLIATTDFTEKTLVPLPNSFNVSYVRSGAAFRWEELYEYLNPFGLAVAGGRVSTVGSSLLLGGGMSYKSATLGWAVNNVVNFELVTASSKIYQVNEMTHPDLFWALKGGSNNFGIITRYDLKTYETGTIFGGVLNWVGHENSLRFLDAYTAWFAPGGGVEDDAKAAILPNIAMTLPDFNETSATVLFYDENVTYPKTFENFTSIPRVESQSQLGLMNFSQLVNLTAFDGVHAGRWNWYSTSILMSPYTTDIVYRNSIDLARTMLAEVNGLVSIATEYVTKEHLLAARASGGDAIDLDPERGTFMSLYPRTSIQIASLTEHFETVDLIAVLTFDAQYDDLVAHYLRTAIALTESEAKAKNLHVPFVWLNNAGITQDPIATYGYGSSLPKMREISKRFDPTGVFQTLVPGFKLGFEVSGA
ncbi:hypothetical protein MMC25_007843 [Agyrium rufum]|nr:hypothetical protein [Agyrium rufum]